MSDIKKIDTNAYVTVQGQYAVVNEGAGYAIINTQTKQVIARNISSFLDCVKTLDYILGNVEPPSSVPIQISTVSTEADAPSEEIEEKINYDTQELDELDLALARGLSSYFEEMNGKICRYHRDHNASQEEANVISCYYSKAADIARNVKDEQDLKGLLKFVEDLKLKVSRYQHKSYKYRWSTGLENEVIAKLNKISLPLSSVQPTSKRPYTQTTNAANFTTPNSTDKQYFRVEIYHQSGKITTQECKDLNQAMQSYSHQLAHYDKRRLRVYAVQPSGESLIVSHR